MSQLSDLNRHGGSSGTISSSVLDPAPYDPPTILYADDRRGSLFSDYFQTLARHRWLILLFALCGVVVSFLVTFTAQPVYRARTSLDIQSVNSDFMNMKAVNATGVDAATDEYVATQIKLLQSDSLLERTVLHLDAEPHPDFMEQGDLASRIELGLYLVRDKPIPYRALLDDASHHVTVKALGATRLAEITCDAWSAEVAAKFCNMLVEQFKQADLETRSSESQKTSEWLIKQVADVKAKAEEAERKLEAATGGNGLVLTQEASGVETDRLKAIQGEYVRAEADRMEKQALAGIGSDTATPNLTQSDAYRHDEEQLADLRRQVSALVPPLTEENEKVIHLRSQIKTVEADLAAQRNANAANLKSDYQAALRREAMQAGAYHSAEASVSADLGKAAKVALLRSDVQANQQLYQTLMQRAREAGFASALQASNIRVVDPAKDPEEPFSPRRGSSAASGLLLGTLCGIGFAFLSERVTTVFRMPGDTERFLGLRELGVIPSSVRVRQTLPVPLEGEDGAELLAPSEQPFTMSNWTENFSIVAEAYRSASVSIMLSDPPLKQGRVYVISSPNAGEGKTTVVSNLGVALSKSGLRVLLIDGDLRKPTLHRVLRVPNDFGMRNLLRGEGREDGSLKVHYQPTGLPNLFVLPAGRGEEGAVELLHSTFTVDLIQQLRNEFDAVVIDTPPMLHMADARILASHAQGAILVVRAGLTSREQATRARDLFEQDGVRMVGTILNDFNPDKNGLSDYYESYSRYVHEVTSTADGSLSFLEWLFAKEEKPAKQRPRRGTSFGEAEEVVAFEDAAYADIVDVDLAATGDASWEPEILAPPPALPATEPPRGKRRKKNRPNVQHGPPASASYEPSDGASGIAFEPPPTSAHYDPPPGVHYDPMPSARYEAASAAMEPPAVVDELPAETRHEPLTDVPTEPLTASAIPLVEAEATADTVEVAPSIAPIFAPIIAEPTTASTAIPPILAEPTVAVTAVPPIAASTAAEPPPTVPDGAVADAVLDPPTVILEAEPTLAVETVETAAAAALVEHSEPEPSVETVDAAPIAEPYEPPPSIPRYEPPPPAVRGTVIVYEPPRKLDEPPVEAAEENLAGLTSEPSSAPVSETAFEPALLETGEAAELAPAAADEAPRTLEPSIAAEAAESATPDAAAVGTPETALEAPPALEPTVAAQAVEPETPLTEPVVATVAATIEDPAAESPVIVPAAAKLPVYEPPPPGAFVARRRARNSLRTANAASASVPETAPETALQAAPDMGVVKLEAQPALQVDAQPETQAEAQADTLAETQAETQADTPEAQADTPAEIHAETQAEAQPYIPPAVAAAAAEASPSAARPNGAALVGLYEPPSGEAAKRPPTPATEEEYQPPRRQPLPPPTNGQQSAPQNDLYASTDRQYGQQPAEPEPQPALGFFAKLFQRGRVTESQNGGSETHDPTQERRKGKRLEWPNLVAHYWDGGAPSAHEIRNISATGLYLLTEERWYPGTQVMMLLQKPGAGANDPNRSITVNAKVVRFGVDGLGFAFVIPKRQPPKGSPHFGANGADRAAIQGFLQKRPRKQG